MCFGSDFTAYQLSISLINRLQVGECLIRAAGTGVCKVAARTWPVYPEQALARLEEGYCEFPPEVVKQARATYEFLGEQPLEYYSTLVEVIEEVDGEAKNLEEEANSGEEEILGCWAQKECRICTRNRHVMEDGFKLVEKYWKKTKKAYLQTKLKLYPLNPLLLY